MRFTGHSADMVRAGGMETAAHFSSPRLGFFFLGVVELNMGSVGLLSQSFVIHLVCQSVCLGGSGLCVRCHGFDGSSPAVRCVGRS